MPDNRPYTARELKQMNPRRLTDALKDRRESGAQLTDAERRASLRRAEADLEAGRIPPNPFPAPSRPRQTGTSAGRQRTDLERRRSRAGRASGAQATDRERDSARRGSDSGRQRTDRERRLERLRRRSGAQVTDEELRRSRRGR